MVANANVTITVEDYAISLNVGDIEIIKPVVTGIEGANLNYTSSDETVFIVENGAISALKVGVATLNISVVGTNATAIVNVTVVDPSEGSEDISEILVIASKTKLHVNESLKLNVMVDSNIYAGEVQWFSNNTSIARVDASGLVTTLKPGTVTITALVGSAWNSVNITVQAAPNVIVPVVSTIMLSGSSFVNVNGAVMLSVSTNTGEVPELVWSTSDETIATVNDGVITGVGAGIAIITASLNDNEAVKGTFTILVKEDLETNTDSKITTITLSAPNEVLQGNKIKLAVSWVPSTEAASFTYASSDTSIATVDAFGWVTGVKGGVVQISATLVADSTKSAVHTVNVIPLPSSLAITGPTSLSYGQKVTLEVAAMPSGASNAVTWTSSNTAVATVDSSGRVTGIAAGSATITATSIVSNSILASHNITVNDSNSITLNPTSLSLIAGANQTITATVNASNLTDKSVTWSSSNTGVATVDNNGKITAVAAGSSTITATSKADATLKATCAVTVTAVPSGGGTGGLTITQSPTGTIAVGASGYQLYITDSSGASVSRLECTFSSSNSSVATVSAYGTISALANGTATINVTHASKGTGSITLTIGSGGGSTPPVTPPATGLVITQSPSGTIQVGASGYQLYVKDTSGTSISRTECTFSSSNSGVATVSAYGTISALSGGSAKITVTHPSKGSGTITLTITGSSGAVENKRNTIIEIALNEVGYTEGYNNNTKYGAWYG